MNKHLILFDVYVNCVDSAEYISKYLKRYISLLKTEGALSNSDISTLSVFYLWKEML